MDKLPVVIVALDPNRIEEVLSNLNFKAAAVIAMIVDRGDQRSIEAGDIAIPTYPLTSIEDFLVRKTDCRRFYRRVQRAARRSLARKR